VFKRKYFLKTSHITTGIFKYLSFSLFSFFAVNGTTNKKEFKLTRKKERLSNTNPFFSDLKTFTKKL